MLGVIGGSGLYQIEGLKLVDEVEIETPWGKPSDKYIITEYKDKKIVFLPRHGKGHLYPPHQINYRANIWGFRRLKINKILSISAVGGINPLLNAGDFVISSQFLDFTKSRPSTFFEGINTKVDINDKIDDLVSIYMKNRSVVHIDVSDPFCPVLRKQLENSLNSLGFRYHKNAVYAATEGPRLETSAEIKALSLLGADIVGMTLVPEVVLAKEINMHFASVSVVTNLAAGIKGEKLTSEEVIEMMEKKNEDIKKLILDFAENLPDRYDCDCPFSLEGAAI